MDTRLARCSGSYRRIGGRIRLGAGGLPAGQVSISIEKSTGALRSINALDDYTGSVKDMQKGRLVWLFNQQLSRMGDPTALRSRRIGLEHKAFARRWGRVHVLPVGVAQTRVESGAA